MSIRTDNTSYKKTLNKQGYSRRVIICGSVKVSANTPGKTQQPAAAFGVK